MEKIYQAPEAIVVEFAENDILLASVGKLTVNEDGVDPVTVKWNF